MIVVVGHGRGGRLLVSVFLRFGLQLEAFVDAAAVSTDVVGMDVGVGIGDGMLLAFLEFPAAQVEDGDDKTDKEEDADDDD